MYFLWTLASFACFSISVVILAIADVGLGYEFGARVASIIAAPSIVAIIAACIYDILFFFSTGEYIVVTTAFESLVMPIELQWVPWIRLWLMLGSVVAVFALYVRFIEKALDRKLAELSNRYQAQLVKTTIVIALNMPALLYTAHFVGYPISIGAVIQAIESHPVSVALMTMTALIVFGLGQTITSNTYMSGSMAVMAPETRHLVANNCTSTQGPNISGQNNYNVDDDTVMRPPPIPPAQPQPPRDMQMVVQQPARSRKTRAASPCRRRIDAK